MILLNDVSKRFDKEIALDKVSTIIKPSSVFGLIGSNGSGKSTLLRILAGVYFPNEGSANIDDAPIFENPELKRRIFYIPDDPFIPTGSTMMELAKFFSEFYPFYDLEQVHSMSTAFGLDPNRKLATFSKGMQRQAHIILALAAHTDYLLCDETFDGLDPVKRQAVRRMLADGVSQRNMTVIIASHNLRELEEICDHIGLLHEGRLVLDRNISALEEGLVNVQCAFAHIQDRSAFPDLDLLRFERRGRMIRMIVRGERSDVLTALEAAQPLYLEALPLTLEEVFITEMEVLGYDVSGLIL